MFTEEMLKEVPEEIARIFEQMEADIMADLIDRIAQINGISRTADYELWIATQLRRYPTDLRKRIQEALGLTDKQLDRLFQQIIAEGYAQDEELYSDAGIPFVPLEDNKELKQLIDAIQEQAKEDIHNITRTAGIVLNASGTNNKELTAYYRNVLNTATTEIASGAFNYDRTLKRVTNELANSGIRFVNYESGHLDRADVAARRAVMTGLRQLTEKISEDNAKKLGTNYFEVSAHITARPSHALWQGRVYTKEQLVSICHLGEVTGLCGANCYHTYDPFIPGISVRRYSDEELSEIYKKTQETKEYGGKKYTPYEATQKQRALERRMRVQDEKIALLKRGGADRNDIAEVQNRRAATYQEYKKFSREMEQPEQMNRVFNSEIKDKTVENNTESRTAFGGYNNKNDPNFEKRIESAERFYEEIRNRKREFEVEAIAKNTGFKKEDISEVYKHVFDREHLFKDGSVHRFSPSYYMQNSFMRLREGKNIQKHDLTLLHHELEEAKIMGESIEIAYEDVHNEVQKVYNYSAELNEYLKTHDA